MDPLAGLPAPPSPPPDFAAPDTDGIAPLVRFPATERAIADLLDRRILTRDSFDVLQQDARRAAFTVARVATEDAIARIRQLLADDIAAGGTLDDFADRVAGALGDEGGLSPAHLENVYRTGVATAYTQGLMETLDHPLVADEFPYLEYHAVHDSRARDDHRAMEHHGIQGTNVYRRDDPIWGEFLPPWDYQCRCTVVPLSLEDAARRGIAEAREWLATGVPPAAPAYVKHPPFSPPAAFRGTSGDVQLGWVDGGRTPGGKRRWKNTDTGETRYQEKMPGDKKKPPKPAAEPKQPKPPVAPKGKAKKPAKPPAPKKGKKPASAKPTPAAAVPTRQLTDSDRQTLARVAEDSRRDLADQSHPMNRLKDRLATARFGDGPEIKTLRSTQDSPLSAKDHDLMAKSHARLATILRINGRGDEAKAHLQATQMHRAAAEKKAKPQSQAAPPRPSFPDDSQPRKFDTKQDDWLRRHGQVTMKSLREEERDAIRSYTGDEHFGSLNAALRQGEQLSQDQRTMVDRLDSAFAKVGGLPQPVRTYRGISLPKDQAAKMLADFQRASRDGTAVEMPGYSSTTTDPSVLDNFTDELAGEQAVRFEINATRGLYVDSVSQFGDGDWTGESELLMPRQSKFRVAGVKQVRFDGVAEPVTVVQMEQLP